MNAKIKYNNSDILLSLQETILSSLWEIYSELSNEIKIHLCISILDKDNVRYNCLKMISSRSIKKKKNVLLKQSKCYWNTFIRATIKLTIPRIYLLK